MALATPSPKRSSFRWRDLSLFALFVTPNLLLLFFFTYKPLFETVKLSFYNWDLISPTKIWVGLDNYQYYFSDATNRYIIRNTFVFGLATVAGTMILGLSLALLLNQKLPGRNVARTALFAPYVVSGAAVGIIWLFVFDPKFGLVTTLLAKIGVDSPNWYNDPNWAMPMVIIAYTWKNLGYAVVIYLAGLQTIPKDLYEAARVDGAGSLSRFRHVTLPQLSPVTFFLLVTSLISSLQAFDIIQVMTRGGPLDATKTMVYQIYDEGFVRFHVGTASAISTIIFVFLVVVTIIQLRLLERKVHYR